MSTWPTERIIPSRGTSCFWGAHWESVSSAESPEEVRQASYRSRLAIRAACRVRLGSLVVCSISHIRRGSDRGVRSEVASLLALEDEIALLKGELSGMGVEKGIETYLIEPGVDTFGLSCKAFWSPKKQGGEAHKLVEQQDTQLPLPLCSLFIRRTSRRF